VKDVADEVLAMRSVDRRGFNRVMAASFGAHVMFVALIILPHGWISAEPKHKVMTISLGGTSGARSTGLNPISGRQVDQVQPPPRRPEPIKQAAPKTDELSLSAKTTKTPAKNTPAPITSLAQPTTGAQPSQGTSKAETGARTAATGLSFGGAPGRASLDVNMADFCCMAYVGRVLAIIETYWSPGSVNQKGENVIRFTINRDGSIDIAGILFDKRANAILDLQSQKALQLAAKALPPLPQEYPGRSLTIHLTFPYGIQ